MKTLADLVLELGRVEEVELRAWIERGWVMPECSTAGEPAFSPLDETRIALICDLVHDLAIEEETVPLVLALLDEAYALRRRLDALTRAVQAQPEDVRREILDRMARQLRRPRSRLG